MSGNDNLQESRSSKNIFYDVIMLVFEFFYMILQMFYHILLSIFKNIYGREECDVSNDIVLITGTGHGIGKELAQQYSDLGATIVCWDINETTNQETVKLLKAKGGKAFGYTVDVTSREKVLEAANKVMNEVGDVTILVNNAGIMPQHLFLNHNEDIIRKMYDINIISNHWTIEAFLPKMMEKNQGHIVGISSIAGIIGFENITPYSASKYAVRGLMEGLREELRKNPKASNIKITTVFPYMVDTGLCKSVKIRFQSLLKLLNPKDVASAIVSNQRKGIHEFTVPRYMYYLNSFTRNLPREVQDVVKDFFNSGVQAEC